MHVQYLLQVGIGNPCLTCTCSENKKFIVINICNTGAENLLRLVQNLSLEHTYEWELQHYLIIFKFKERIAIV